MSSTPPAVALTGLRFAYPEGITVLDGIDLAVESGERVAVLGANGSGKSTLLLHLNGILTADAGCVSIGGVPVERANLTEVRRRVGMVFQEAGDQLFMRTVRDDVAFGPANLGIGGSELDRCVAAALAAVGLPGIGNRISHHLSVGEQRRVAIATVLAMGPDVLALDEPTSNLDPRARRQLIGVLEGFAGPVLAATHDLPFALELCPRSVLLAGGRIVADGPTADLMSDDALLASCDLERPYAFTPPRSASHEPASHEPASPGRASSEEE